MLTVEGLFSKMNRCLLLINNMSVCVLMMGIFNDACYDNDE